LQFLLFDANQIRKTLRNVYDELERRGQERTFELDETATKFQKKFAIGHGGLWTHQENGK